MSETEIENEIQAKGLNAPRLTPEAIDGLIVNEVTGRASELFKDSEHGPELSCLTICVLTLRNGFTIVGKSACASPENYDAEIGRKIALEDARKQIWPLAGYQLKSDLAAGKV